MSYVTVGKMHLQKFTVLSTCIRSNSMQLLEVINYRVFCVSYSE